MKHRRLVTQRGADPSVDEEATNADAEALARDLESMGPTFVKLGQLLSHARDLLPAPYLQALARLQDDVEPFPFDDVEEIVEAELGARISKAFAPSTTARSHRRRSARCTGPSCATVEPSR